MQHSLPYFLIDAFTPTPFKGNSAPVVLLNPSQPPLSDETLQSIAIEFNLAETAFLTPIDLSRGHFGLRWFTPTIEFPLCGHATLAAASVIFSHGQGGMLFQLPDGLTDVSFETMSGILKARLLSDGRVELDFPAGEVIAVEGTKLESIGKIIRKSFDKSDGLDIKYVGKGSGVSFQHYRLVEIDGVDLQTVSVDATVLVSHPDLSSEKVYLR